MLDFKNFVIILIMYYTENFIITRATDDCNGMSSERRCYT
jgi:hypothetical protein